MLNRPKDILVYPYDQDEWILTAHNNINHGQLSVSMYQYKQSYVF